MPFPLIARSGCCMSGADKTRFVHAHTPVSSDVDQGDSNGYAVVSLTNMPSYPNNTTIQQNLEKKDSSLSPAKSENSCEEIPHPILLNGSPVD